ncbi:hypothetical protein FBQ81_13485 [Chloroflexi bacterium CFX6]|nr:hypothetical protein [Chloroflexi bacterium CFX6]
MYVMLAIMQRGVDFPFVNSVRGETRMKTTRRQLASFSILIMLVISQFAYPQSASAATNRYVVASGGLSSGPCDSWGAACTLQRALTAAVDGDEIWVQQGTYTPGAARADTFTIPGGVAVYGGFVGTETARSQRNPDPANTILSGDIGTVGDRTDNSFHIVTIANTTTAPTLDGFTVTLGHVTDADGNAFGAGIYIVNSSPTLNNLIITDNRAGNTVGSGGGGVYMNDQAGSPIITPVISNVTFSNNRSGRGGGLFSHNSDPILENVVFIDNIALATGGGGMNSQTNGAFDPPINPILTNVSFINNTATGGGGLFIGNSTGHLTNVTFSGNVANRRGGGLLLEFSTAVLTNVTFYNNTSNNGGADPRGGGGLMNVASSPTLNNVTFSGNTSTADNVDGSAMRNAQEPVTLQVSNPVIHNSVFWGDTATEITSDGTGSITVNDSIVQGGCPAGATCTNVLNSDPLLGALANNGGFTQTMALGTGSAAIDAGNNSTCASTDQRGVTRPQGTACDMGAYEVDVPPTITDRSPAPSATDVAVGTNVTVTFSEPMNPASITNSTFTLRADGAGSDVPATVSYANQVATLDPTSDLASGTLYNVTVSGSVADLTGNTLGSNDTWSFTTSGGGFTDTTAADFNAGTVGDCVVDNTIGDGAVRLNIPSSTSCVFESRVFDAGEVVNWNNQTATLQTPDGTTVNVEVHTGNTPTPNDYWSGWGAVGSATTFPYGRYIQYRASLSSPTLGITPVIENVNLFYATPEVSVLLAPSGSLTNWANIFSWTGVSGATAYLLEVYTDADVLVHKQWFTTAQAGCDMDLSCQVSPTALGSLAQGNYKWWVEDYGSGTYGFGPYTTFTSFALSGDCYILTMNVVGSGSVPPPAQTCSGGYTAGTVIQLTALPSTGFAFGGWSGDASGTTNPVSITMNGNKNVTATFRGEILIAPNGSLTSWNNTFSWTGHSASAATHYFLQVQKADNTVLLNKWYTAAQAGCDTDTSCDVIPSELASLGAGNYKWHVRDYGAYGYGPYSPYMTFDLSIACYTLATSVVGSGSVLVPAQTCSGGYTAGTVIQLDER